MPKETMTPRERWLATLNRQTPDRVPTDYWATPETTQQLMAHLGVATEEQMFERLHIDRPLTVGPVYCGPALPEGTDIFGIRYEKVDYGTGAYHEARHHPLAAFESVEQIEAAYTWPTADWFDFSGIAAQARGQEHRPIMGGYSEPMLIYKNMRGEAQAFMDMLLNPELIQYCLDKLFALAYETARRIYEQIPGQVTLTMVAEDMGAQDRLMYSVEQIRQFLLPGMKRMIDLAHQAGAYVFHHNDGACREILPDMIALGIDILNPIQWPCRGMEREGLKRDFGARVIFHGAVDNQQILPFGTPEQVRAEVATNLSILGAGGGYILAPCHNIQPLTPPENIVALYETGLELGWS